MLLNKETKPKLDSAYYPPHHQHLMNKSIGKKPPRWLGLWIRRLHFCKTPYPMQYFESWLKSMKIIRTQKQLFSRLYSRWNIQLCDLKAPFIKCSNSTIISKFRLYIGSFEHYIRSLYCSEILTSFCATDFFFLPFFSLFGLVRIFALKEYQPLMDI